DYGALMLALALYCMLRYQRSRRIYYIVAAGFSVGLLALFKHNIGSYALLGFLACLALDGIVKRVVVPGSPERSGPESEPDQKSPGRLTQLGAMALGFAAPIIPVLIYLGSHRALEEMTKTLLFGPGEFLVSRLAGAPSPLVASLFLAALAGCGYGAYALRLHRAAATAVSISAVAAVVLFCLLGRESWVSEFLFYAPALVIAAGLAVLVFRGKTRESTWPVGPLMVAAAAAFMETFPRFAREQVIAAM